MKHFNLLSLLVLLALCLAAARPAHAQTGPNGDQYEACANCGIQVGGYIFGQILNLNTNADYQFCSVGPNCNDGWAPIAPLLLGPDKNFYGVTYYGGAGGLCGGGNGCGTVWEMNPYTYGLTTLYSFCMAAGCADGYWPDGGLIQGPGTTLYGTTSRGGAHGYGTVFEIVTASGRAAPTYPLTTIYSFSGATDGAYPSGSLTLDSNGDIHGTTTSGGANGDGTAFVITPGGTLKSVTSFGGSKNNNGSNPNGNMQEVSGSFYGTTAYGGKFQQGTIFKVTKAGDISTIASFDGTNGATPLAGLVLGTDGNLYGTTSAGGSGESGTAAGGTAFRVTTKGKLTTLQSFSADGTDGYAPAIGLFQDVNGNFYGLTSVGGATGQGGFFSLSEGLAPFVETLPASGPVGTLVTILGDNLTDATSVTFKGIEATFTVVSSNEIDATVPDGAKTGTVQVVTSGSTLSSNVPFTVEKK